MRWLLCLCLSLLCATLALAQPSANFTLQSAAAANGDGTAITSSGFAFATVQVETDGLTGTVNWEGSQTGANYAVASCKTVSAQTFATTAAFTTDTTITVYHCAVAGLARFRARLSNVSAGSVTITATLMQGVSL